MIQDKGYPDFDEYIRQGEPSKRESAYAWSTAIGLQAVDGLKTSDYLNELARRNIEGEITMDEVSKLLDSYYSSKISHEADDDGTEEADKASKNIKKILSTVTLDFTANGLINIHRRIFEGVFKHAGELRRFDITKREWVLEGDTVRYLNWEDLRRALDYDIKQEKEYAYHGVANEDVVKHLTDFVAGLWQIHPFREGNTRTTAVFTILYLRSIGFNVENDLFAKNSWYFRNALVRANYKNAEKGIGYSPIYLERFFRNLLLGERWELRNRYLHIHAPKEWSVQPNLLDPYKYRTSTPTSTGQVPDQVQDKYRISSGQARDLIHTENYDIISLVKVIGMNHLSVKEMMAGLNLKGRDNFLNLYLMPSISEGYVRLLYPDKPHHPRQKYLLTVKGSLLYNELINLES